MNDPRRYLSLALIALTLAVVYGIWYSYGVVMVALLKEFGWSRSVLAGAFSVFTLMHGVANPLVGWICGRVPPQRLVAAGGVMLGVSLWVNSFIVSPWQLYLGFGLLTALAVAASGWVPALIQAQQRFADRLGLALGIVSSGVGVGMLLVVPLYQFLIDTFGWRIAYRTFGTFCAVWIMPVALYLLRTAPAQSNPAAERPAAASPATGSAQPAHRQALTLAQASRSRPFWLIVGAFFFGNVCAQTLHVHQVAYLVDHGIAAIVAASVVSVVGASSIVAKIAGGWVSDIIDREIVYMTGIGIMLASVGALVLVGMWPSRWGAYGFAVLLGAGYSVTASVIPVMASDRFSGPHFGAIVGIGLFGSALGSAVGPWMAGWLFDRTGSYGVPLMIVAASGAIAAAAGWLLWRLRLRG